jgi:acetyl-CoA carboxylase biotin carboxylase subunit
MGDKITAKDRKDVWAFPVVPGSDGGVPTIERPSASPRDIGYPVIIKATAGGGGRGMKVAQNEAELWNRLPHRASEAKAAFGNDAVYMEKYLQKPRHIEIQVFGDGKGNAVHLGERDCSLQRRHQKVWEEAPPGITPKCAPRSARSAPMRCRSSATSAPARSSSSTKTASSTSSR